jgi:hypothetical protein
MTRKRLPVTWEWGAGAVLAVCMAAFVLWAVIPHAS